MQGMAVWKGGLWTAVKACTHLKVFLSIGGGLYIEIEILHTCSVQCSICSVQCSECNT